MPNYPSHYKEWEQKYGEEKKHNWHRFGLHSLNARHAEFGNRILKTEH
jgi:hypothetical protein